MNQEEDFVPLAGDILPHMRLLLEGAVVLLENETTVLIRLATEAHEHVACLALNDIGSALYDLRRDIIRLESAHQQHLC